MRVDYAKLVAGVFRGRSVAALLPLLALFLVQTKALSAEDDQYRRQDKNDPRWSVMIFGGTSAEADRFVELMAAPWVGTYGVNNFVGAAFSSRFYRVGNFTFEGEVGAGYRFKDFSSSEMWGALYLRYDGFPWNHLVYTTFAVNTGLNYAEKVSPVEIHSCSGRGNPNCWNLLHYFSPEVTFANPINPNLEMVIRWHHRSGAFGLMNGTWGGSNILTAGIRARF